MREADYLKIQAKVCRRLARASDEREARILNDLADEYDARAGALDTD